MTDREPSPETNPARTRLADETMQHVSEWLGSARFSEWRTTGDSDGRSQYDYRERSVRVAPEDASLPSLRITNYQIEHAGGYGRNERKVRFGLEEPSESGVSSEIWSATIDESGAIDPSLSVTAPLPTRLDVETAAILVVQGDFSPAPQTEKDRIDATALRLDALIAFYNTAPHTVSPEE